MEQTTQAEAVAEAREIILKQMKTLQEQTNRMISANSATPAAGVAAPSHEIAELGRTIFQSYGRA